MDTSSSSRLTTLPLGGSSSAQFIQALLLPFRAARFLWRQRSLWRFAVLPALLHMALFATGAALVMTLSDDALARWVWAKPTNLLVYGWYIAYGITLIVGLALAYILALLLGGIVVSPLNDALSERAEHLLLEETYDLEEARWHTTLRSVISTAFITAVYAALLAPVLLLNLVPGLGSAIATVLGVVVSAFFLAWEYTDICFARHGLRLRHKLRLLLRRPALTFGFGAGTTLLMWAPLLNVLVMPAAVVGGTALALHLRNEVD